MGLVKGSIPSMIGGVSQQPSPLRHPSQMDEIVNMVPDVATGLRKRNGTHTVTRISTGTLSGGASFVHAINRGTDNATERFHVQVCNGFIVLTDFTGGLHGVVSPDGSGYLASSNPREDFAVTTVEDYTFIVNKTIKVAMTARGATAAAEKVYYVIKYGVASSNYTLRLAGVDYTYTTGAGVTDTNAIATGVAAAITGGGLFTVTQHGNLLEVAPVTPGSFDWSYTDSYGDQGSYAFSKQVNRYEQLPAKFVEGPVIEVKGDPNNANDSFYVTWKKDATGDTGTWRETVHETVDVAFDASTMPHILTRNPSTGVWTFQKATWADRLVGDDNSNPAVSFVGKTINNVFFFRDRLGFLSDENVIMSKSGDYFNFWADTARAVIDSDPIDITGSTTKVTILRHAVPFDKAMLIFSDKQQYQMTPGEILSPRTARLEPTTAFETDEVCAPAPLGRNVFFTANRGRHTALREYYFSGSTVNNDASDVAAHVPTYLPAGVFMIAAAPTEDLVFAISQTTPNVVYVYNSFWNGDEKVQSAWHKWVFDVQDEFLSVKVVGSAVHFIVQRPSGIYHDALEFDVSPWAPVLDNILNIDRLVVVNPDGPGISYNSTANRTYWTLAYPLPSTSTPCVVLFDETGAVGQGLTPQIDGANIVSLPGDHTNYTTGVGIRFDAWARLSPQHSRDQKGNAIVNERLQLRDLKLQYQNAGYFEVWVTPKGRETSKYIYSGTQLGFVDALLGITTVASGYFAVPIMARGDEVVIEFHNTSHMPATFLSAEWVGYSAQQTSR